jgi:hypothetical protein
MCQRVNLYIPGKHGIAAAALISALWHSLARSRAVSMQIQESASRAPRRANIALTISGRVKARPQASGEGGS